MLGIEQHEVEAQIATHLDHFGRWKGYEHTQGWLAFGKLRFQRIVHHGAVPLLVIGHATLG